MPRLSISYSGNSSSNTATSTSSVYITDSGEKRIIAFITGPQGPQGPSGVDGTGGGAAFIPSGYITTGQADARYYGINNPSGYITGFNSGQYITTAQTGQFYPTSNPNSYATSGNLSQTGSLLIAQNLVISGIFQSQFSSLSGFTTGISGVLQSQINALPTIENLGATGSNLFNLITGLSGQNASDYATKLNLTQTGVNIYSSINALSGFVIGNSGVLQTQINTLATNANLALTGSNLFALITGASGQASVDYATKTNLALTGQQTWNATQNNALNLSGNLTLTGQVLGNSINSLSGFTTGVSGFLRSLIQGSAGGVSSINGQSGAININSLGNIFITTGANTIFISGDTGIYSNFATVNSLNLTGYNLYNLITGSSGQSNLDYALKTSLTQTGATLNNKINSLSGFIQNTSGFLQSNIDSLSTNLYSTGALLYSLFLTGIPTGFLTTGSADLRYYSINNPSGFITGFESGIYISTGQTGQFYPISNPSGFVTGEFYSKNEIDNLFIYSNPYFFERTSSDISGYDYMVRDFPSGLNPHSGYYPNAFDGQFLTGFITETGYPGLNGYIRGTNTASIHAKIVNSNSKDTSLYYKLYNYPATGSRSLVLYSTPGNLLTILEQHLYFSDYISGYQITPTDRLGIEWYAAVAAGPGVVPDIYLIYNDNTAAAETLPLNAQLLSTTYYQITNPQGYSTSGNLAQTGSILNNKINSLSGYSNSNFATITTLAATGQELLTHSNNNSINLSGNLTQSGILLLSNNLSTSGALNSKISSVSGFTTGISGNLQSQINTLASSSSLQITGSNLYNLITGFSGQSNADFATKIALTQSGVLLINQNTSLSGFVTGVSGYLNSLIQDSVGGVSSINGQSGILNINGLGNISITTGANTIFISGDTGVYGSFATVINLASTGSILTALITGLSGQVAVDYATKTTLALTGQQSWSAANNNAINLSGNLAQTGVTLINQINSLSGFTTGISGFLRGLIQESAGAVSSLNGQSGILNIIGMGNISVTTGLNTIIISGDTGAYANFVTLASLQNTGSSLYIMLTGLSGQSVIDYATKTSLTQTGVILNSQINSLSGFSTGFSGALQFQINSLPTAANLALTGSNLFVLITGLSGQANINYATIQNLATTGQQAWTAAQNNGVNLSGNLVQTGVILGGQVNSLSGFVGGISGSLQTQIAALATTTNLALTGSNLFNLITGLSGSSDNKFATIVNLALTGSNLFINLTGLSGIFNSQIANTGSQVWNVANNNGINLSGNLTLTGQALFNRDASISGGLEARISVSGSSLFNLLTGTSGALDTKIFTLSGFDAATYSTIASLVLTGSNLFLNIVGLSGAFDTKIQSTGQQAWNASQNNAVNLSGNLTQTGVALLARDLLTSGVLATGIAATGAATISYINSVGTSISGNLALTGSQAWNATNDNGLNLSGNLTQTGVSLIARDLAISGVLQAQIGVGGTQVKVTGSASISVADFTGIGTTLVFVSGGQIFISGAPAGAGAGDVTQAQLDSLSGWTSTNLTQTGILLAARDLAISGALQAQISMGGGGSTGNSQFASKTIAVPVGVSGLDVVFDVNFSSTPIVVGNILFTGDFVVSNLTYVNSTGFGLTFTDTIYETGYIYNYLAISGNLLNVTSTGGVTLTQLNSLSGFTTGISGYIQNQINTFPLIVQGTLTGTTPDIVFTNNEQALDWILIGNSTPTASSYAPARNVQLFISGDSVTRTFSWPAWTWIGGAPASSAANKKMRISLESRGSVAGNVFATYAEET